MLMMGEERKLTKKAKFIETPTPKNLKKAASKNFKDKLMVRMPKM